MKKVILTAICFVLFTAPVLAAPGDTIRDETKAIWQIATHSSDVVGTLTTNMAAMPEGYQVLADQQEWAFWLKINLALDFGGKLFHQSVYNKILYSIEGYKYGDPRVADAYAPPECTAGSGEITCEEDPTGESRLILLWRFAGGEYTEQDLSGVLASGIWTFGGIPGGTGNLTLAYDDSFSSFPTVFLTVLP